MICVLFTFSDILITRKKPILVLIHKKKEQKTRPNMVKIETKTFRVDFARVVENSTQIENFKVSLKT